MTVLARDENHRTVMGGVADNDLVTPLPTTVDHLTNRVLIDITEVADVVGTLPTEPDPRDENRVPVAMGVSDLDGITPLPVLIDDATGLLFVDLVFE